MWTPTHPDTALWTAIAVGQDCPGIEVGRNYLIAPRAAAFETPIDSDDEAIFKFEDILGVEEKSDKDT